MNFTLEPRRLTLFGFTLWTWTVKRPTTNTMMKQLLRCDDER